MEAEHAKIFGLIMATTLRRMDGAATVEEAIALRRRTDRRTDGGATVMAAHPSFHFGSNSLLFWGRSPLSSFLRIINHPGRKNSERFLSSGIGGIQI